MIRGTTVFFLLALLLSPALADDEEYQKIGWIAKGKEAVKLRLNDPDSAQFRNVYFHRGKDNLPLTCGEVNSKNGFGGYVGFQHFISGGSPEYTFFENEVEDFAVACDRPGVSARTRARSIAISPPPLEIDPFP